MIRTLLLAALCSAAWGQDLRVGVMAYYPFDVNSDDQSGKEQHGFATVDTDYAPGIIGSAAAFVRRGSGITIPWTLFSGEYSVAAWIYLEDGPHINERHIVGPIWVGTDGVPYVILPTPYPRDYTATTKLETKRWYHVAYTYKQDRLGRSAFYLNGVADTQMMLRSGQRPGTVPRWEDPSPIGGGDYYMNGRLDDLIFYNRPLTPVEVQMLVDRGKPPVTCGGSGQDACQLRSINDLFHPVNWVEVGCNPGLTPVLATGNKCQPTGAEVIIRPMTPITLDGVTVSPVGYEAFIKNADKATFHVPRADWPANCQRLRRYADAVCAANASGDQCRYYRPQSDACSRQTPVPSTGFDSREVCGRAQVPIVDSQTNHTMRSPLYTLEEWRNLQPHVQLLVNGNFFSINLPAGLSAGGPHIVPCTESFGYGVSNGVQTSSETTGDLNKETVGPNGLPNPLDAFVVTEQQIGSSTVRGLRIVAQNEVAALAPNAKYAISGFIIAKGGRILDTFPNSTKPDPRYARAALGITADGTKLALVVIQPGPKDAPGYEAGGLTIRQLAQYMFQRFNTPDVLNLDNGGSSMMLFQQDGQILKSNATDRDPDGRFAYRPLPSFLGISGILPVTAFSSGSGSTRRLVNSPCDLNWDGAVDNLDVQIANRQATGMDPCGNADVTGDGKCDAVDVQRIVVASTGGACRTGA